LQDISLTICKAIYKFYKLNKIYTSQGSSISSNITLTAIPSTTISIDDDDDNYEEEILGNPMLLKVGCEPSDGSDS
jgi:hypothetical protein